MSSLSKSVLVLIPKVPTPCTEHQSCCSELGEKVRTSMHIHLLNPPLAKAVLGRHIRCGDRLVSLQATQHAWLSRWYTALGLFQRSDWHGFLQIGRRT